MENSQLVDVIILSYSKTEREYLMTRKCLESLHASEASVRFNVVLVETSSEAELDRLSGGERFGDRCHVVFPNQPFNYNQYLQIAFRELGPSTAPYLLISNNDVVFQPGFATELMWGLTRFHSVSPWCPGHHEEHFSGHLHFYPGYRTSLELCGWSVMFRKEILRLVPFPELFPVDFEFWFQDNFYAVQLRRQSLTHALVRNAKVMHLFAQSHDLLDTSKKDDVRYGALEVFERKVGELGERRKTKRAALTIAMPVDVSRFGPDLWSVIEHLATHTIGKPVEVMALVDNGYSERDTKAQSIAEWAQGEFIVFVNDHEGTTEDFVDRLLAAIVSQPNTDRILPEDEPRPDVARPLSSGCLRTELARRAPTEVRVASPQGETELTVCVLGVPSRASSSFASIMKKLARQAEGKAVEILGLLDNKFSTIGRKRNILLSLAKGRFLTFVDDDDDVAYDYVDAILATSSQNPDADCIVFDAWVTQNGNDGRLCRYGIEFEDRDTSEAYFRKPNHICCLRREVVRSIPFEDLSYHEDFRWASAIYPRLRRQARIARTLYSYQYSSTGSESGPVNVAPAVKPVEGAQEKPESRPGSTVEAEGRSEAVAPVISGTTSEIGPPIFGFMHVALLPGWRGIVDEQLLKLHASGLYHKTRRIFVGLVGTPRDAFDIVDDKLEVAVWDPDLAVGELPTLDYLDRFCRGRECRAYYIHTKGVSRHSDTTRDWRQLMEYFVIVRHEDCLRDLETHDACGVNWHAAPLPHFSGNFWWTKSSHIRTLPTLAAHVDACSKIQLGERVISRWWSCEFWIGANPQARVANLHESGVNHYEAPYPRWCYGQLRRVSMTSAYDSPSAWRGLENRFQELLEPIGNIRTIVEIGVEFGFSLFCLAAAAPQATVIGIDPYQDLEPSERARLADLAYQAVLGSNEAETWVRRQLPEFDNVLLLRARGEDIARCLGGQVDVVHLDSVHAYDDLAREFRAWEPLVRPGGCVLFHDTESFPEDVGRYFAELPGPKAHLSGSNGLGAWYKSRARGSRNGSERVRVD